MEGVLKPLHDATESHVSPTHRLALAHLLVLAAPTASPTHGGGTACTPSLISDASRAVRTLR